MEIILKITYAHKYVISVDDLMLSLTICGRRRFAHCDVMRDTLDTL